MPCRKAATYNGNPGAGKQGGGGFATEAECLEACKEGACCEGTTCSIKPQCQCQGTGKTFKGIGTTCSPNPCYCAPPGLGKCCGPRTLTYSCLQSNVSFSYVECNNFFTESACVESGGTWTERECCQPLPTVTVDANCGTVLACNPLP